MVGRGRLGRTITAVVVVVVTSGVAAGAHGAAVAAATSPPPASFQMDPVHDGYASSATVTLPLHQAWSVPFYGAASFPVVAGNDVYVIAETDNGSQLLALDSQTGGRLWASALQTSSAFVGLAYDGGRVFAETDYGTVMAYYAGSGGHIWTASPDQNTLVYSAPTAVHGVVYVTEGNYLFALNEATGHVIWSQLTNGDYDSAPVVTPTGVFVSYDSRNIYDLSPTTGQVIWHDNEGEAGLSGATDALHDGRLYVRYSTGSAHPMVLDAASGRLLGTYSATAIPAFDGALAILLNGTTLREVNDTTGATPWTFSGDGHLISSPIIGSGLVFESSSSGTVYALSEATGRVMWTGSAGGSVAASETTMQSGNSIAGSMLFVTSQSGMVAYSAHPSYGAVVSSIDPNHGPSAGGTPIVIRGSGFTTATSVRFGSTAVAFHVLSDSEMTATSPQGANGIVDVVVGNGNGPSVSSRQDLFSYADQPPPAGDAAVTYQMDVGHTGAQTGDSLTVSAQQPLRQHWQSVFPEATTTMYPLVVGDRVYELAADMNSTTSPRWTLYALDGSTGAVLWLQLVPGSWFAAAAAYDNGRIFVSDDGGTAAYDAGTGVLQWWTPGAGQVPSQGMPTASGGVVYVSQAGNSTVAALDEQDGHVIWTSAQVLNGQDSPITPLDGAAYVAYACGQAYSLSASSGATNWHHWAGCEGGGGGATPLFDGRLWDYQNDPTPVQLDPMTGLIVGSLVSATSPAFDGDTIITTSGSTLTGSNASTGTTLWSMQLDTPILSPPITDNHIVYVGTSGGYVYAVDDAGGSLLWSQDVGSAVHDGSNLVAADDMLLVPAGGSLIAYGP